MRRVPCRLAVLGGAVLALIGISGSAFAVSKGTSDLTPVAVSSQRYGHPGGAILARGTVKAGKRASRGSQLGFYLSSDGRLDAKDVGLAGRVRVPALKAGRQYKGAGVASIPKTAKVARYYVLACLKTKCHASRQRIELTQDPVTSRSLIDAAVARGEIDKATGLLYRVYAAFADARLPAKLDGDDIGAVGDDSAIREAASSWSTLPAGIRKALGPFFRPPMYKGSWAQRSVGSSAPAGPTREAGCASDELRDKFYVNVPTANGKVRVWWRNGTPHSAKLGTAASSVAKEVNGAIWPKLTKLMGREPLSDGKVGCFNGEDGRYDIYLYFDESLKGGASALTIGYPGACTHTPAFTVVDVRQGLTRWEIAHELFHAIQFAYTYKSKCEDYEVMDEATATWAGNYVYPSDNVEHQFLGLLSRANGLYGTPGFAGYNDWTFFYSMTQRYGNASMPALYAKTESADDIDAVDRTVPGGIDEFWPLFMADTWNQEPVDESFRTWDKIDEKPCGPGCVRDVVTQLSGAHVKKSPITVEQGGMEKYYLGEYPFEDEKVRYIEITNPGLGAPEGLSLVVFVQYADGHWARPDWLHTEKVTFCRDDPAENVKKIVLWYGNSLHPKGDWHAARIQGEGQLEIRDSCLPEKFTGTFSGAYASPGNDRWSGTVTFQLKDVEYEIAHYDVVGGSVTWQEDPHTSAGCSLSPHSPLTAPLYVPSAGMEIYMDRHPMEYAISLDNTVHYPTMPVDYACEDGSSGTTQQYPPCCAWLYFYDTHYVPDDFQLVGSFAYGAQSFQWNLAPPGD